MRAIVEEERQKLLKEHASKLLGYLPRVSQLYLKCSKYKLVFFWIKLQSCNILESVGILTVSALLCSPFHGENMDF